MKKIYNWFKTTTTHKCATVFIYIGAVAFIIVALVGWFQGKENAVGMMNCAAMVIIANSAQYAGKSAYEHKLGIFSNPIVTSTLNGLASNDPTSGVAQVANAIQMQNQYNNQPLDSDIDQGNVNDNSVSSSMGQQNIQSDNQDSTQNQNINQNESEGK